jgi:carboxypeptidase Q
MRPHVIPAVAAAAFTLGLAAACQSPPAAPVEPEWLAAYRPIVQQFIDESQSSDFAWQRLAELTDTYGPRLSGSENLEQAIDWAVATMQADGLENVHKEPVMVPKWVRGRESLDLIAPARQPLPLLGLGNSVGTPAGGVEGDVIVVRSFDELDQRASDVKGRIVLFNVPFTTYGETVRYRSGGAVAAARAGAVASMIRSVTPYSQNTPHTGGMAYNDSVTRIPHAAITPEDADMIARMVVRGERVAVTLTMSAHMLPDAQSRNVIAELRGTTSPDEVVVMGGHIDSWDVGRGAMDDAGGVVVAWEAIRLLKELGLRPRRTIRVVGWTNEENGLRGGNAYRDAHRGELDRHVAAIESDAGVFKPRGFGFTGSDAAYAIVRQVGTLLGPIGSGTIQRGGGGADIGPIMALGVPGMGLNVDGTRYFWYHHTDADTVDKLDPHDVALCVATMAVMAYVLADMPERLPR